jgi:replicative DNA helicase
MKMKKRTPKTTIIENLSQMELLSISDIASPIHEDIEHIYGLKTQRGGARTYPRCATRMSSPAEKIHPIDGELVCIATRTLQLREECLLWLVHHVACTLNKTVVIYSASDSFIRLTSKLINVMADIPWDAAIYDGKLSSAELKRLTSALTELKAAPIYLNPIPLILFNWLRLTTHKLMKQTCNIGLVLVDGVQYLIDEQRHCVSTQQSLMGLKGLAEELRIPVVALYQLDPTIESHPSTLTRYELGEMEALNELTDGLMLMSGTHEKLVFATPKIPKAKPVEWIDQISRFTWHQRN